MKDDAHTAQSTQYTQVTLDSLNISRKSNSLNCVKGNGRKHPMIQPLLLNYLLVILFIYLFFYKVLRWAVRTAPSVMESIHNRGNMNIENSINFLPPSRLNSV